MNIILMTQIDVMCMLSLRFSDIHNKITPIHLLEVASLKMYSCSHFDHMLMSLLHAIFIKKRY